MRTIPAVTITAAHLDAALAAKWDGSTCLIAQAFGGPTKVMSCGGSRATLRGEDGRPVWVRWQDNDRAANLQRKFDHVHGYGPRDNSAQVLREIREALPYTIMNVTQVEVEVDPT